jgi:tetratricopeptide (TPR) repeat protein
MLKLNNHIAILLVAMLLTACGSTPKPELTSEAKTESAVEASTQSTTTEVEPEVISGDQVETGSDIPVDSATAPVAVVEPEPIDLDQLAYVAAIDELKNGRTENALDELQRLTEVIPEKPRLFTNLGLAHFHLQQYESAEPAFQQAITYDLDDAVAHNHLGILQRRKGDFQGALQAYQRAIEIDEKYAHAHLNLGILFDLYLQDLEKALQQYRKYQALTSDDNSQVAGWIVDIERRLKTNNTQTQE